MDSECDGPPSKFDSTPQRKHTMEKVRSGESVTIKASTWNSFIDAANYVKEARQNQRGKGLRSGIQTGIVASCGVRIAPAGETSIKFCIVDHGP